METLYIPEPIRAVVGDRSYALDDVGLSDSAVVNFGDAFLKIEETRENSENEYKMLTWLQGKLPVPEILAFTREGGKNYLLLSPAEGAMSCAPENMEDPEVLAKSLAKALQLFQSVDVDRCPCSAGAEVKLRRAEYNLTHGLCSTENVEPETYGPGGFASPEALYKWLCSNRPEEETALTHGDFCLPNVFLKNGEPSGFIDLGNAGAGDPYMDIALCWRSLRHNYEGAYGGSILLPDFDPDTLFAALDITPDREKLRWYLLLDELF